MAAISGRFVCFDQKSDFESRLSAGDIPETSIVFIKDDSLIWTHNVFFGSLEECLKKTQQTLTDTEKKQVKKNLDLEIVIQEHGSGETSASIAPNVFHKWGEMTSLSVSLAEADDNSIYNEYMFEFVSGSTATTLSLPSDVIWVADPSVEAGKTYQCSIVNGLGVLVSAS